MCQLSDYDQLRIYGQWYGILQNELEMWHRDYLPVHGTVLDLGAGCGETVQFFLLHGAERVIAIEKDPTAYSFLIQNFLDDARVTILPFGVDSIKIDIDGAEEGMVLETHFPHHWKCLGKYSENGPIHHWRLERS